MLTQPGLVSAAGGLCAPCGSAACLWRVLLLWGGHAWGPCSLEVLGREHMALLGSLARQQPAYQVERGRHGFDEGKGRGPQHCVSSSQKLSLSAPPSMSCSGPLSCPARPRTWLAGAWSCSWTVSQ